MRLSPAASASLLAARINRALASRPRFAATPTPLRMSALRLVFRGLLKSPGYTLVATLTLALGIGVNTAMFSLVRALLFRSGPFPEPARLAQVMAFTRNGEARLFSAIELDEIRARSSAFASLTTVGRTAFSLGEPGRTAERVDGAVVSTGAFATFGVQPMLGRAFAAEEFLPGRNQVVLLGYRFWQQRYAGDPGVIGRSLRLDGENVTIVGVMPPRFDYRPLWGGCALWRPLNFTPDQRQWRDYRVFTLIGRLAPGASLAQAGAELAPLATAQEKEHPESYSGLRYRAVQLDEALVDHLGRRISWMLLGLSGFVLLIACANLANLQLARATTRLRELAIRAALGASRARLIAQQLTESLVVSLLGGALGLFLAFGVNRFLEQAYVFGGLDLSLDAPILGLTLGVSLLTGVVFGLVPAWLASRTDLNSVLKQQSRGSTGSRGHHRLRQALIVAEVSLAFVLLGGAVILQRGFARLLQHDGGWDASRLVIAALPVPESRIQTDPARIQLFRKLEDRLAAIPGVEHAALATSLPVAGYNGDRQVLTEGQTPADSARLPAAFHVMVSSDYFATMGIPLIEGRLFPAGMKATDPRVIVINEALARRLWPGRSAVGQRLGSMDSGQAFWAEVIGVVRDVDATGSVTDPSTPFQVYKPLVHEPWSYLYAVVRSTAPASLVEDFRRAIADVDADLAPDQVGVVRQLVEAQQHNLLLAAKTLAGFAVLGLALAAIGLYGVISNVVAQRTGEFGVRLALGARPRDVLALVLGHGLRLTAIGLGLGLGGVWALGRFLGALLPRIAGLDPLALGGVAAGLFGIALLACFVPARRATQVDPIVALRAE